MLFELQTLHVLYSTVGVNYIELYQLSSTSCVLWSLSMVVANIQDINQFVPALSCFSASDDNILKNIEMFDKLSLRFHGRVNFVKDVSSGNDEICCWTYYGRGVQVAEISCTSIVYTSEKKQTKVSFDFVVVELSAPEKSRVNSIFLHCYTVFMAVLSVVQLSRCRYDESLSPSFGTFLILLCHFNHFIVLALSTQYKMLTPTWIRIATHLIKCSHSLRFSTLY